MKLPGNPGHPPFIQTARLLCLFLLKLSRRILLSQLLAAGPSYHLRYPRRP